VIGWVFETQTNKQTKERKNNRNASNGDDEEWGEETKQTKAGLPQPARASLLASADELEKLIPHERTLRLANPSSPPFTHFPLPAQTAHFTPNECVLLCFY